MNQSQNKNFGDKFDFTKNYDPKDTMGQFVKKAAIALHYKTNYKKIAKIAIICSIIFSVGSFFNMIAVWHQENTKVEISSMQEKNKTLLLEQEQNIKIIKTYTQEDIDNTVTYLKKTQAIQLQRTVDFYWKFKYISDKNVERYPVAKTIRGISELRTKINEYFDSRVIMIPKIYSGIANGDKEFNNDDLKKVIHWHNSMKTNINTTYQDLDNYLAYWNEDFIDQKSIQAYLDSNKELIAKTNPFL